MADRDAKSRIPADLIAASLDPLISMRIYCRGMAIERAIQALGNRPLASEILEYADRLYDFIAQEILASPPRATGGV